MKREDAFARATQVARLITNGNRRLGNTPLNQLPLLATLPFLTTGGLCLTGEANPFIQEILIFGSVARREAEVGDIDMMILDGGFYSSVFQGRTEHAASRYTDWYQCLGENLRELLIGWFGFEETDEAVMEVLAEPVDLHILPAALLLNSGLRQKIAEHHRDPQFLDNAFSDLLRYNRMTRSFEPTSLTYLEERHSVSRH